MRRKFERDQPAQTVAHQDNVATECSNILARERTHCVEAGRPLIRNFWIRNFWIGDLYSGDRPARIRYISFPSDRRQITQKRGEMARRGEEIAEEYDRPGELGRLRL